MVWIIINLNEVIEHITTVKWQCSSSLHASTFAPVKSLQKKLLVKIIKILKWNEMLMKNNKLSTFLLNQFFQKNSIVKCMDWKFNQEGHVWDSLHTQWENCIIQLFFLSFDNKAKTQTLF